MFTTFFRCQILGAKVFISLEYDYEMSKYEAKKDVARRVDSASEYLGATFWNYVYDHDRFNFSNDKFVEVADTDLRTFVQFVVNATREHS